MKILFLAFFFLLFLPTSFALEVEAGLTGGIYNNPRVTTLRSNNEEAKILWTNSPDAPMDESFIYTSPIFIRYSQEIWFFAFTSENEATPFQKEKYIIRVNPRRYSKEVYISKFSPQEDWIEIRNTDNKPLHLQFWSLKSRHENYQFNKDDIIPAHGSFKQKIKIGDILDKVELHAPDSFVKDFFRYKLEEETENVLERKKDERKIFLRKEEKN